MRAHAALAAGAASLLSIAAAPAPPPWTCTRPEVPALPSEPSARDVRDHGLSEQLRRLQCELDTRRHLAPERQETCYFGPETLHISAQRYDAIRAAHKDDPVEFWHALLSEPEDPTAPPIEARVISKSGPNCGDDRERELEDQIEALQKELNFR